MTSSAGAFSRARPSIASFARAVLLDRRLAIFLCLIAIGGSFAAASALQMRIDRAHALAQAAQYEKRRANDLATFATLSLDRIESECGKGGEVVRPAFFILRGLGQGVRAVDAHLQRRCGSETAADRDKAKEYGEPPVEQDGTGEARDGRARTGKGACRARHPLPSARKLIRGRDYAPEDSRAQVQTTHVMARRAASGPPSDCASAQSIDPLGGP